MMKNAFFFVYVLFFLFMTQRLNRAEFCRLSCGINTKEDTDQRRKSGCDKNDLRVNDCLHITHSHTRRQSANSPRAQNTKHNPDKTANQRNNHRLHQKLE